MKRRCARWCSSGSEKILSPAPRCGARRSTSAGCSNASRPSFASSGLYLVLLRRFAVSSMSYLQFTTAAVAAGAGVLVGGEQLAPSAALGALAVLAGLFFIIPRQMPAGRA